MVRSLEHARPIVNGYSGQRPAFFTSVADALADPASIDARATLRELDVRFVVSPDPIRGADRPDSPYVERETFGDETVYELVWTEENEAALEDVEVAGAAGAGAGAIQGWRSGDLFGAMADRSARSRGRDDRAVGASRPNRPTPASKAPRRPGSSRPRPRPRRGSRDSSRRAIGFRTSTNAGADATAAPAIPARRPAVGRSRVCLRSRRRATCARATAPAAARDATALALPLGRARARCAGRPVVHPRAAVGRRHARFEMPINEAGRNMKAVVTVGPAGDRRRVRRTAAGVSRRAAADDARAAPAGGRGHDLD